MKYKTRMKVEDLLDELYLAVGDEAFSLHVLDLVFSGERLIKIRAILFRMSVLGETRYGYSLLRASDLFMLRKDDKDA